MWIGIEGHDQIVEQFRRTLAANRLASTYLFIGPEGVGKRAFALKLAQTLLCLTQPAEDMAPCGECESCRLLLAGNHPDLDLIGLRKDKRNLVIEQFIGKDELRNRDGLCHSIAMRPMLGNRRVAIIDDADRFTVESANCLLKTLEEPPPGAVMILIGTSRGRQLPTILSRAQVIRFHPLPADVVSKLALAEGLADNEAAAARIAERSGGSMALARSLADEALFEIRDRVFAQWKNRNVDAPRLAHDLGELIDAAGKDASDRRDRFRQFLALLAASFAELAREQATSGEPVEATLAAVDRTLEAAEQVDRNANQSTLLEAWLDDLGTLLAAPRLAEPRPSR